MLPNVTWNGLPKTSNLKQRWLISPQNNRRFLARGKEYNHLQKSKDGGEEKKMAQVPITSGYVVTLLLLPVATRVARFVRSMINAFRTTDARHSENPKERWVIISKSSPLEGLSLFGKACNHPHCFRS